MKTTLQFDTKIFSKDAVLSTCYWCADRIVSDVTEKDGNIVVSLCGRKGCSIDDETIDEFKAMVVHNQLRHQLKEKFDDMDTDIISKAFRPVSRVE